MNTKCKRCERTESQIAADAKTLGLLQELDSGVYTCCQISQWAHEQWFAWFEAIQQDGKLVDDITLRSEFDESEVVLVPVRVCQSQVPWYKNYDNIGRHE
ncbi:MAG TPA: hypothetical protein VMF91_25915 [Bryobacteraceae bacterium]|nr:hypothetical protein [Bryobacteraceae bacterium]